MQVDEESYRKSKSPTLIKHVSNKNIKNKIQEQIPQEEGKTFQIKSKRARSQFRKDENLESPLKNRENSIYKLLK